MTDLSGALGLCIRARACSYGFENAMGKMQKGSCHLVLINEKASEKTKKRILDKCKFYKVSHFVLNLSETYNKLNINENVMIISVNDINFKNLMEKRLKGET